MADFLRYWRSFAVQFLSECYHAWRAEVFSTLGIAFITFLISRGEDTSAKAVLIITIKACLIWLAVFGFYHLLRTPWKLDRDLRRKLDSQADKQKIKERIERLSLFVVAGHEFMRRCTTSMELVPHEEVDAWAVAAAQVIEEAFDATYLVRFGSGVGMPMYGAYWPNLENRGVYGALHVRVYRLQQFIDELREQSKAAPHSGSEGIAVKPEASFVVQT